MSLVVTRCLPLLFEAHFSLCLPFPSLLLCLSLSFLLPVVAAHTHTHSLSLSLCLLLLGQIYNFNYDGARVDTAAEKAAWLPCLVFPLCTLARHHPHHWDEALARTFNTFSAASAASPSFSASSSAAVSSAVAAQYHPLHHNCLDFVIEFCNVLGLFGCFNWNKSSFTRDVLQASLASLNQFCRLRQGLTEYGFLCHRCVALCLLLLL